MSGARVARLTVRAPPPRAAGLASAVASAIGRASPGGGRLLIVRRMQLGVASSPVALTNRTGAALARAAADAVHGGHPEARFAGAVWFRDDAEALSLLLAALAAGRLCAEWYWRLAVRVWAGGGLAAEATKLAAALVATPGGEAALARVLLRAATGGGLLVLAEALAPAARFVGADGPAAEVPGHPADGGRGSPRVVEESPRPPDRAAAQAAHIWSRLAAPSRIAVAAASARASPPARRLIAWSVAVAEAPALLASPMALLEIARALETTIAAAWSEPAPNAHVSPRPRSSPRPVAEAAAPAADVPAAAPVEPAAEAPARPTADRAFDFDPGQTSAVAGTLLVIGALDRIGFGAWLLARPERLAAGFGTALLHEIARWRLRDRDDALLALLPAEPASLEWSRAWRAGLRAWLRRAARVRLADIAATPGRVAIHDGGMTVTFRTDQAHIGLRRLALDRDPGWVPWLGCDIRYRFVERVG